ncbi:hypothetical protein BDV93DRAFT_407383, partial [Ceratobasidium sp. AG-I]
EDPSFLRLAYLNAVASNTVRHNSIENTEADLKVTLDCLELAGALTSEYTPVRSLPAVRRHLGLETDIFMIRQPVCTECFKPYSLEDINSADTSKCTTMDCDGEFWQIVLRKNLETRSPAKYVTYSKLVPALRRMFLRPDFVQLLRSGHEAHQEHLRNNGVMHDICDGVVWASARVGMRRSFRTDGSVCDEPQALGSEHAVADLGYGLVGSLNIDWFKTSHNSSTGGIYLTILSIHRSARYLPSNTILVCVVPGPREPKLENLNYILEPIVEQFKKLYAGVVMKIYGESLPATVHFQPIVTCADVPARAKAHGLAGHAHENKFCICNRKRGACRKDFIITDDDIALQQAKLSQVAPNQTQRNKLHKEHGIRWSAFNELPDWKPYLGAPFDLMHNLYLGIVHDLWGTILMGGYYFTAAQRLQFDAYLETIVWPSQIGRLPKSVSHNLSLRKADEWRRLVSILPIALWVVWGNQDGSISPGAPPIPPKSKPPRFERCQEKIFQLVVLLSAASQLFTTWAVRKPDVHRAQTYLQMFCQGLLRMNAPMKPNHHYAMHYELMFERFGPAYAWWLFAYERYNGLLEKVKTNGKEEHISTTLMRFWIRMHRLYEYVESMPGEVTEQEKNVIAKLCFTSENRGTLLASSANLNSSVALETSKSAPALDLYLLDQSVYPLLLQFAQTCWPHLNLISERNYHQTGTLFLSKKVARHLDFVSRNGLRFGSTSSTRTHADSFALAQLGNQKTPCQIQHLVRLEVGTEATVICAIISPFVTNSSIAATPWDLHAMDLGYYVAIADQLGPSAVVEFSNILSPITLAPVPSHKLWVAVDYDRV